MKNTRKCDESICANQSKCTSSRCEFGEQCVKQFEKLNFCVSKSCCACSMLTFGSVWCLNLASLNLFRYVLLIFPAPSSSGPGWSPISGLWSSSSDIAYFYAQIKQDSDTGRPPGPAGPTVCPLADCVDCEFLTGLARYLSLIFLIHMNFFNIILLLFRFFFFNDVKTLFVNILRFVLIFYLNIYELFS